MKKAAYEHKGEVSDTGRYRPNLSIDTGLAFEDQILQNVLAEIDQYSITPTTLKARNFFSSNGHLDKLNEEIHRVRTEIDALGAQHTEFRTYEEQSIERLKNLSNHVIESGEFTKPSNDILALAEKFTGKIAALEAYLRELEQYNEFIGQNPGLLLSYNDSYENGSSNKVTRFGINTADMNPEQSTALAHIYTPIEKTVKSVKSGSSKGSKVDQDFKKLHPLEVSLIRDAIDYLESPTLSDKTVLVDIFAREDNGAIRLKNNKPETHTIVLHKNAEQVIVIDPSNPDFSKHISDNTIRLFRESEERVDIIAPLKQKIYAPSGDVGPRADQYRDCIDVAVKIAFGLNKLQGDIDVSELKSLAAIREITNQQECNAALFFIEDKAIARIRQASDDTIRASTNNIMVKMKHQITSIDEYFRPNTDLGDKVLEDSIAAFSNNYSSDQYMLGIENIYAIYSENTETFINEIRAEKAALLGEVVQLNTGEV